MSATLCHPQWIMQDSCTCIYQHRVKMKSPSNSLFYWGSEGDVWELNVSRRVKLYYAFLFYVYLCYSDCSAKSRGAGRTYKALVMIVHCENNTRSIECLNVIFFLWVEHSFTRTFGSKSHSFRSWCAVLQLIWFFYPPKISNMMCNDDIWIPFLLQTINVAQSY